MKNKYKRLTVILSPEEYEVLKTLAHLRKESAAKFARYLLRIHIENNKVLLPHIKKVIKARGQVSINT